jgi:hypothetical protein
MSSTILGHVQPAESGKYKILLAKDAHTNPKRNLE